MPTRWLTLIRHAKAVSEQRGERRDFERPLAPRGEGDAVRMARRLAAAGVAPDLIVSSSARRAAQTAAAIAPALDYPPERIEHAEDLYLAGPRTLLEYVHATDRDVLHLALVGHNPGLSDLWGWLTGDPGANLPTCGIARLELEADSWSEVLPGCAVLLEFDYPKRVGD